MKNRRISRSHAIARSSIIAAFVACGPAWAQTAAAPAPDCLAAATPLNSIDMRVLVIAADGNEVVLPAIKAALDYVGVPYDVMIAKDQMLSAATLCSAADGAGHARYQGVLLTTGSLGFENASGVYESALSWDEWNLLWAYEAKYRIRQATFYTYPGDPSIDTYGLTSPTSATSDPIVATLTSTGSNGNPSGRQLFADLKNVPTISHAYTYLATPAANSTVTPLLVDAAGHAIASINNHADGRKNLALTADGNPYLLHSQALGYGIVNWVTKGLYLGQRKVYMSAQPDDVMIADDIWVPSANSDAAGKTYRITASDYGKFITWQANRNKKGPGNIFLDIPFNASGTVASEISAAELYPATRDDLTPAIKQNSAPFTWLSHTYTHLNLDAPTSYAQVLDELKQNDSIATKNLRLANYYKDAMITPDVSGLNNPEALAAMSAFGIRYVVSNTSINCGHRSGLPTSPCPEPNVGIYNDLQPNIMMAPRYPANLFYNVSTPAEWVSEYNFLYRSYWGRDLNYAEIIGVESDVWLRYLLNFDMRPVMFHQPNMRAYDGTHSLLGDLIDATVAKLSAISALPPQSLSLRQIGSLMAERMRLKAALAPASGAALTARILPGATTSNIVLSNPTSNSVTVPITGVSYGASRQTYGNQTTSKIVVNPRGGVTVTGAPAW